MSLEMGHVGSKCRSLGQNLEKPCVRSKGHIFSHYGPLVCFIHSVYNFL